MVTVQICCTQLGLTNQRRHRKHQQVVDVYLHCNMSGRRVYTVLGLGLFMIITYDLDLHPIIVHWPPVALVPALAICVKRLNSAV